MSRRAKAALLLIVAALMLAFLIRVRGVLTPFYLAFAIAYLGNPVIVLFERRQVPRSFAILLLYALVGVAVTLMVYAVLPSLGRELEQIVETLPEQTRRLEELISKTFSDLRRVPVPNALEEVINLGLRRGEALLGQFAAKTAEILVGMVTNVVHLILAPILAYYLLKDYQSIKRVAVGWLPKEARRRVIEMTGYIHRVVGGFIRGQLIVSAVVGALIAAGFSVIGVRYALILGLIAGIADIIPYFGPIISAVPALVLALLNSPLSALWTLLWILAVNQFEASVLGPKIVGREVGLHPLTVVFAILSGGELMGITGMLLAVPVAAAVKVTAGYIGERLIPS